MAISVFSQELPAVDRINSSSGVVEMHFIGHGSLMFSVNNFFIYIDPVRSSGSYDNLPKADLILVTHEHGDHLDNDLIKTLRKDATVLLSNEKAAASVSWAKAVKAGEINIVSGITVMAVPAYNIQKAQETGMLLLLAIERYMWQEIRRIFRR
jgi:L-ascorbate metabolism protein UlaG (beta-lactamase superfamily)